MRSIEQFVEGIPFLIGQSTCSRLGPIISIVGSIFDSLVFPPLTVVLGYVRVATIELIVGQFSGVAILVLDSSVAGCSGINGNFVYVSNMAVVEAGSGIEPEDIFVHLLPVFVPVSPVLKPAGSSSLFQNALLIRFVPSLSLGPEKFVVVVNVSIGIIVGVG